MGQTQLGRGSLVVSRRALRALLAGGPGSTFGKLAPMATRKNSKKAKPFWERGYDTHGYWRDNKKIGWVALEGKGKNCSYRWQAGSRTGEAKTWPMPSACRGNKCCRSRPSFPCSGSRAATRFLRSSNTRAHPIVLPQPGAAMCAMLGNFTSMLCVTGIDRARSCFTNIACICERFASIMRTILIYIRFST